MPDLSGHTTGRESLDSSGSSYPWPFKNTKFQCTNNFGELSRHFLSHAQERRLCRRNRLYLFRAQRPNNRSILIRNRFNAPGRMLHSTQPILALMD